MARRALGPRSSAGELWDALQRERKRSANGVDDGGEVAELRRELERARARERAVLDELAGARMDATDEGLGGESIAGKPALAKMRSTWARFASAVGRLPTVRKERGFGAIRFVVAKDLLADLDLFELDAPHGTKAAEMRDLLRRMLTHPALVAVLSSDTRGGAYARTLYLEHVGRYYLRPSVWRIYEKASDEGIRDALGTVYK